MKPLWKKRINIFSSVGCCGKKKKKIKYMLLVRLVSILWKFNAQTVETCICYDHSCI